VQERAKSDVMVWQRGLCEYVVAEEEEGEKLQI